jgi:VanZ family protein
VESGTSRYDIDERSMTNDQRPTSAFVLRRWSWVTLGILVSRWLPVLAWMGLIFVGSSRSDLPTHPNDSIDTVAKKAIHGIEYGILAALLWRALTQEGRSTKDALTLKVLGLSLLYALSDELHQHFTPGRCGSLGDVLLDGISMVAALAFLRRWGWPGSQASSKGPIARRSGG